MLLSEEKKKAEEPARIYQVGKRLGDGSKQVQIGKNGGEYEPDNSTATPPRRPLIAVLTKVGAATFSHVIIIILFIFSNPTSPLP